MFDPIMSGPEGDIGDGRYTPPPGKWCASKKEDAAPSASNNIQSAAVTQILQLVERAKLKISNGNMCPVSAVKDLDEAAAKLRTL